MTLVAFQDVHLALGGKSLLRGASFAVEPGDRAGLVGPNGSGKTTLLRLLAAHLESDGGRINRRRGLRVGYLPQEIGVAGGQPLLTFVRNAVPNRRSLEAEVAAAEHALRSLENTETSNEALLEASSRVAQQHQELVDFEHRFGDHHALKILSGLGFTESDRDRDIGEFSGGWQMRALLAALLFTQPDLLLLDEPTNHLDMPSVAWFSEFLKRYDPAILLVSHDREFLNEQIDRVISLEPEGLRTYRGNYDAYRKQRAEEATLRENQRRNLAQKRAEAEQFIERFRAQATKAKAVQSRIKMLEKMASVAPTETHASIDFTFPPCRRASNEVLRIGGIAHSFGERTVLRDVQARVHRGEKIGIIGPNGAGKTTLLRILAQALTPNSGNLYWGHHVTVGYFAQDQRERLNPEHTVVQAVMAEAPSTSVTFIRSLLGALLFSGDAVDKPVRVLSGGERSRVALACLLVRPSNVMLLDEPTNHLDLDASERLLRALQSYDGTIIFVSHNRAFLKGLATSIWHVQQGGLEPYPGTLDDYLTSSTRRFDLDAPGMSIPATTPPSRNHKPSKERKRQQAQARAERRRVLGPIEAKIAQLEADIDALEQAQSERTEALSRPDAYDDPARAADVSRAFERDRQLLENLTEQWEDAHEELEAATETLAPAK